MRLALATFCVGFALAACAFYLVLEFGGPGDTGESAYASNGEAGTSPATPSDFYRSHEREWSRVEGYDEAPEDGPSGAEGGDAGPSVNRPAAPPPIPTGVGPTPSGATRTEDGRFAFEDPQSAWRSFVAAVYAGNLDRAMAHLPPPGSLQAATSLSATAVPTMLAQLRDRFVATYGEAAFEDFASQVGGPGGTFPVPDTDKQTVIEEQVPVPLNENTLRFLFDDQEFIVTKTDTGWIVQGDLIDPGQEQVARMAYEMEAAFANALAATTDKIGEPGMGPQALAGDLQQTLQESTMAIFQGMPGGNISNPDYGKDF